ncbi:MAG: hypothetical protein HZC40_14160 [Chloroflexi bacterium]|nr:hypothetical protein [Chloroflexota bacterium]
MLTPRETQDARRDAENRATQEMIARQFAEDEMQKLRAELARLCAQK